MKRILLLLTILLVIVGRNIAQNVFDPADPIVRYSGSAAYGTPQKPDTTLNGLQKWCTVSTNGVSSGSGSFDASSFKSYFIVYYGNKLAFRLKFPRSYLDSTNKKYPMMLFLHGAGEVGCASNGGIYNNEKQLSLGGKTFMNRVNNNQFDGFLIYPQLRSKDAGCWGEWGGGPSANFNTIITIIDSMVKYARADIDRLFIDGLSGGGVGTWRMAESYPQRVAKIAPTSAAGLLMNYGAFVHIPIWLATGGKDTNPSPTMAAYSAQQVNTLGGNIRTTLYADLGHSSWDRHWAEADFVPYMNDVHKANPLVFFGRYDFCPDSAINTRLGITSGFYAYEWQKDSVTIATRTNGVNTIVNNSSIINFTGNEITVKSFGSYRVRFKRSATADWSDFSPKPAVIKPKAITQTPPLQVVGVKSKVLPSLDAKNTVTLQMPEGFQNYQWYRTTDNVLVSTNQMYEAPVGTYKARYSEPFGCGTEYSPVFKVVAASGTPKPDPAKNLSTIALSQTTIRLDWNDNPNAGTNETGFEIYRGTKAGGPYTLLFITPANAITYQDANLIPNTKYYYVVRSVSETGAAAASNESSITTEVDNEAPTAPSTLEYRGSTSSTVLLRWKAATDNIGIGRYDIYVNGAKTFSTTNLYFTVASLDSLTSYTFTVKAVDKAGNPSPASNQVTGYTHRQGLSYGFYTGTFNNLPNFDNISPVLTGVTDTINSGAGIRTQDDNFAFLWQGRIYIPVTGTYVFETASDDGSKLYVDVPYAFNATALVNNDGAHSLATVTGSKYLTKGYHSLVVSFSEVGGGEDMQVYWSNPGAGMARELIPKNFYALDDNYDAGTALVAPSSFVATPVSYNKINLTWIDNTDNETGFEIVRSTSMTGTFSPVITTPADATSYSDSGLVAATKYFYKIRAINSGNESPYEYNFTEVNWKFNNNYTDANGNSSRTISTTSNTSFSTGAQEGSHAVSLNSSSANMALSTSNGAFLAEAGYNQRTVAAWIKPNNTTSKSVIFDFGGSDNGLAMRFSGNALMGAIANASVKTTVSLSNVASSGKWIANGWNHVALVYDVNTLTLYLNGDSVTSNNTLSFPNMLASSNASRIGGPSSTSNSGTAFNDGSNVVMQGLIDNFYVIRGALSKDEINVLKSNLSAQSAASTSAAPTAPTTPSNLVAEVLSTDAIKLTWKDNSNNETKFEIWRSSGDKTNNRLITTVAADDESTKTYTDTALFANVTYYYKVRAAGVGSPSGYTAEVNGKTLNTKPKMKKILDFTMRYGTTFTLPVSATDEDGDILTFSNSNLPTFGAFQNVNNGNANIVFSPAISRQGAYPIKIFVSDGNNGRDTSIFNLIVNSNDVPVMPVVQNITMQEGGQITVPLSATDNNGTTKMAWRFEGLPSFGTFTNNNNGSGSLAFNPGYSASGSYEVTAFLSDGFGAWTSRTFTINVEDREPDGTVQVNFRSITGDVPGWNDVMIPALTYATLKDTKGVASTIGISLSKGTITASQAGTQTGNNTGVYPDKILKDLMTWGFNAGNNLSDTVVLRITGLDVAKRYNFVFMGSYNASGTSASLVQYKIADQTATNNYYLNTAQTDTIENISPDGSGQVLITMIGDANVTRGGALNALVIKAVYDDGSTPAKPLSFAGSHVQNLGVRLTWVDRAYNETAYRVFRSTSRTGNYTVLNPSATNKDSASYLDNTVVPESQFYYYVAGVNAFGTGVSSDTILVSTGNNQPLIAAQSDIYVKTDAVASADFTVTDDPGDAVTVALANKPSFVTLENLGSSNYRITVSPTIDNLGWFKLVIKATDSKGAVATRMVNLSVSDKNTRSVFVNFGSANKTAPLPWNNFLGIKGTNATITALKDETSQTTPFGIVMSSPWGLLTDMGHITGNNTGVYPDSVLASGISDVTGPRTIRFTGLNDAKRYNIVFVGSQNEGIDAITEYSSGTTKDTLNARYNTNQTGNLNGLTSAGGVINVNAGRLNPSGANFLNAMVIEEYDPSLPILNPINLYAEPVDRATVDLSWSDRTVNEDVTEGYILERATDSSFSQNVVTTGLAANTTTFRNTGLTANTKYWYRVRAKSAGGAFSDYSNRAKTITPASIVYVNFNYTMPDADAPWNNTFTSPTVEGATLENFTNQSGIVAGITLELTKIFNGEFTAGVVTGNNSGVVPDKVLASDYWLDNTQQSQFTVSGLNHSRRYRFGFFGSSSANGWFKGDYTATYSVGDRTVYLNSWMNKSKIVYIGDVAPDENGEVALDFSTTAAAVYGFNGGFLVEEYSDVPGGGSVLRVVNPNGANSTLGVVNEDAPQAITVTAQAVSGRMYPNPFTDFVSMDFNNTSVNNNISVDVYDVSGRLNYHRNYGKMPQGNNTLRLSAADGAMQTGVYIISLNVNGKSIQTTKMIRAKN